MRETAHIPEFLKSRLRADPIPNTVARSLPVLFFGDLFSASVATIGINPSWREYLSRARQELQGADRRFETLTSFAARSRNEIRDAQALKAIDRMRGYFDPQRPIYGWFASLERVVEGMGISFRDRAAVHLDLVQEATDPAWTKFQRVCPETAGDILRRDLEFLRQEIEVFPLAALVCSSARVLREVRLMFRSQVTACGKLARVNWEVGVATIPRGVIGIAGWNIPLARATGLDRAGQRKLGQILAGELANAGISVPLA